MAPGRKTGGRQAGTPNKVTGTLKRFITDALTSEEYKRSFDSRLRRGELPPTIEQMLWFYALGKPKEVVQVEGNGMKIINVILPSQAEMEAVQHPETIDVTPSSNGRNGKKTISKRAVRKFLKEQA